MRSGIPTLQWPDVRDLARPCPLSPSAEVQNWMEPSCIGSEGDPVGTDGGDVGIRLVALALRCEGRGGWSTGDRRPICQREPLVRWSSVLGVRADDHETLVARSGIDDADPSAVEPQVGHQFPRDTVGRVPGAGALVDWPDAITSPTRSQPWAPRWTLQAVRLSGSPVATGSQGPAIRGPQRLGRGPTRVGGRHRADDEVAAVRRRGQTGCCPWSRPSGYSTSSQARPSVETHIVRAESRGPPSCATNVSLMATNPAAPWTTSRATSSVPRRRR